MLDLDHHPGLTSPTPLERIMSYAYHPLSRVGAFTKGSANVRTYETQITLWETPVSQCADCMATVKSECTCERDRRAAERAAKACAKSADAVDWKPAPRQGNPAALRDAMIERHLDRLQLIPAALVGAYLSALPKALRLEIVSYL